MVYSLTDKLKFDENPRIEIKGRIVTVNAQAETVLKLMDIVNKESEIEGAIKSLDLLFSEEDKAVIEEMKLSLQDFLTFIETAITLATGGDPDAKDEQKEQ